MCVCGIHVGVVLWCVVSVVCGLCGKCDVRYVWYIYCVWYGVRHVRCGVFVV